MPTESHPYYFERISEVADGLRQGFDLTDIVAQLLRDRYGPAVVVRSVRDGASVEINAARALVDECLGDGKFTAMWSAAESRLGNTANDAVAFFERSTALDGELDGTDWMDWDDTLSTIAVERMRQLGSGDQALGWFRERLAAPTAPHRWGAVMACVAIDRLSCPKELIGDLLAAAVGMDASTCRAPIATITRTHGPSAVLMECERLRASGDPRDEQAAGRIEYWLSADRRLG